ncbi:MAG TPA: AI-2E family transporter [Blastocatellia bacterium]|nr:AI-2E family transporter [Blastocatellia bacterium]
MEEKRDHEAQMVRLWTRVILRVLIVIALFYLAYKMVFLLSEVLLLLVLCVFFCYLIAPFVRLFEQPVYVASREFKISRGAAIVVVYLLIGLVLTLALQLMIPIVWQQGSDLAGNLPSYVASASAAVSKTFNDANSWLRQFKLPSQWRDYLLGQANHLGESFIPWLEAVLAGTFSNLPYLLWLILIPILSFFMLKDASAFERWVVDLMPNDRLKKRAHWLLLDVSQTLAAYIRAQITSCIVVGALVTVGFGLIGVPYAVVLGLIAGVLEFVPLIGPLLAATIAFSLTLTTSVRMALIVALFLVVLRIVQDYIIYPRIVGQGIKMHPAVVVVAILAGAEVGGLAGIFLAIPFVGLVIVAYNHYVAYRRVEATKPAPPAETSGPEVESHLTASASTTGFMDN